MIATIVTILALLALILSTLNEVLSETLDLFTPLINPKASSPTVTLEILSVGADWP